MGTFTNLWSVLDISLFYRESNKRNEGWDQLIVGVHLKTLKIHGASFGLVGLAEH